MPASKQPVPARTAVLEAGTVLQLIGLTAGEAFVVTFLGGFIITAHYWPKLGAWLSVAIYSRGAQRRHHGPEK